ncbi:MAG: hypothetical protein KGY54_04685 [Oleiphilaceae bacterium]|nr:hypothetical protein [Oleiphilaceae bacterium]
MDSRHPLWRNPSLADSLAAGEHGLSDIDHGRRETFGSDAITGQVREVVHLPTNSWLPLFAALFLTVLCISLLVRAYPVALVGFGGALFLVLHWSWRRNLGQLPLVPAGRTTA